MKTFGKTCATLLVVILLLGAALGIGRAITGSWDIRDWGKKPDTEQTMPDDKGGNKNKNGGAIVNESTSNGIKLMSAKIAPVAYAANGISAQADSAYKLTATVTPADAMNKAVDWSIAWVNGNGTFASGKTVTDYVTVTPTSDGALTANVECKQAFGEQIKVTVTSRDNPAMKAECTVDYAQKVTDMSLSFGDIKCVQDNYTLIDWVTGNAATPKGGTVDFNYTTSTYTLAENFNISVDVDLYYSPLGKSPFSSLNFKNKNFLSNMTSAIVNNESVDVYFNETFFVNYLVGNVPNLVPIQGNNWNNNSGAINFVHALFEGEYENSVDSFYITITVTLDGTYSDYTYTTKLAVGSYTHVSDVTGVSVDKSNLVF